jgi:hypothetical protein
MKFRNKPKVAVNQMWRVNLTWYKADWFIADINEKLVGAKIIKKGLNSGEIGQPIREYPNSFKSRNFVFLGYKEKI